MYGKLLEIPISPLYPMAFVVRVKSPLVGNIQIYRRYRRYRTDKGGILYI